MDFLLTPAQQSSLDLNFNISVTANAGAGKTYVLARRFVDILLKTGVRIPEVAAITFTEQAAGQLKRRIHDVVTEMEAGKATTPADRVRLRDIRARLASAQIGTIHSFCARLLRLFPVEAGVDASFSVVEGQERERLIGDSIRDTVSKLLVAGASDPHYDEFRSLVGMLRPARMERYLVQLFRQREQVYRLTGGLPGSGTRPGDIDETGIRVMISTDLSRRAAGFGWHDKVSRVIRAVSGETASEVAEKMRGWTAANTDTQRARLLHEAHRQMFTAEGGYRRKFLGKGVREEDLPPEAGALKEFNNVQYGVLHSLFSDAAGENHRVFGKYLTALLRVYERADELYSERKDELGVLDFEDLQIRTLGFLAGIPGADRRNAGYRFILVDEFQDTNGLQYSIVKLLMDDFHRGNAFIVGDPKQSIYGFRNAEVEVFSEACHEISVADQGKGAPTGPVVLRESFRPLPRLAGFINRVFPRLLPGPAGGSGVEYEELVVARQNTHQGSVELHLFNHHPGGEDGDTVRSECSSVAAMIGNLVAGGGGAPDDIRYTYGDCAVLLRDRKHLLDLERAFENEGIPYVLAGGIGYFQTQEILDFLNYLSFLLDAGDDVALAGILRSPFFCLGDDDLFLVSLEEGESLWEKMGSYSKTNPVHVAVLRALSLLRAHFALVDRMSASRLLRIIATETGWLGTIAGLVHGPQHRENFIKLVDLARTAESKGTSSLYDFVDYLSHHADTEEREGQASTAVTNHAVRIMTIHAAKGLEFPVVFLPFSHRSARPDPELLVDPRYGIGFSLESPDGKKVDPPMMAFLRMISGEKRRAEEKRVFYVACTRARDKLFISGQEREPGGRAQYRDSPVSWLADVFNGYPVAGDPATIDAGPVPVTFARNVGGKMVHETSAISLKIPVFRIEGGEKEPGRSASPEKRRVTPKILTAPLEDHSGGDTYSATQIRTYLECPALYYFRSVIGINSPPGPSGDRNRRSGEDDREDAGLEGVLTHTLLSGIFSPDVKSSDLREKIAVIDAPLAHPEDREALERRVIENILSFTKSEIGRSILNMTESRTEFRISTSIDGSIVSGIIDRMYRAGDGMWEIVDYKTDEAAPEDLGRKALFYRPQLDVYALLVHRLFRQPRVRARLVFLKPECRVVDFEYRERELSGVLEMITKVVSDIREGKFSGKIPACADCPDRNGDFCAKDSPQGAPTKKLP